MWGGKMKLYLARPSLKDEEDVWRLIDEYNRYEPEIDGIDRFEGIRELANIKDFKEWILKIGRNRHKENIPSHLVPSTLYLAKQKSDGNIVGAIILRHCLNDNLLKYGGHIGYSIRPTERKKGYGSEMLKLALAEYKSMEIEKVLVTCKKENLSSSKVILNNGGIFENEILVEERGCTFLRYWISTTVDKL
jgi:predicted acetyltransferase